MSFDGNRLEEAPVAFGLEDLERQARLSNAGAGLALRDWVALAEAWRIAQALHEARGNRSAAARALGIGRRTLYSKMEKLGIVQNWRPASPQLGIAPDRVERS